MNRTTRALLGTTGVCTVVAATVLTGGTSAYFYDHEGFGFGAGACDLKLDKRSATVTVTETTGGTAATNSYDGQTLSVANLEPGDKIRATFSVTNSGTCVGDLYADLARVTGDPALAEAIVVKRTSVVGSALSPREEVSLSTLASRAPSALPALNAGGTGRVVLDLEIPLGGRGEYNEIRGTELGLDLDFGLVQTGQNPGADLRADG